MTNSFLLIVEASVLLKAGVGSGNSGRGASYLGLLRISLSHTSALPFECELKDMETLLRLAL